MPISTPDSNPERRRRFARTWLARQYSRFLSQAEQSAFVLEKPKEATLLLRRKMVAQTFSGQPVMPEASALMEFESTRPIGTEQPTDKNLSKNPQ
jgi:hypothetical protein